MPASEEIVKALGETYFSRNQRKIMNTQKQQDNWIENVSKIKPFNLPEGLKIKFGERPTCDCGNPNAYWDGSITGLRTYACAECHKQLNK